MAELKVSDRWYQTEAVEALWHYFREAAGNPVIAMPTGTGKSVVIARIVHRALTEFPRTRILNVTHVKELIKQNHRKLLDVWPTAPAGIYSAGLDRREAHFPVTYAGIASIAKRPELFGHVDLAIVDECHTVSLKEDSNYQTLFKGLLRYNPDLRIIGLSATPYRLGQGMVTDGGLFTDVCYDLTSYDNFNRLIAEGWLCLLIPRPTNAEIDVSGVRTTNGDYNLHDLQAVVDREEITRRALAEVIELGDDRRHWLVFAAGIIHADHIADALNALGVPTVSVHNKMTWDHIPKHLHKYVRANEDPRDAAIRLWKTGYVRCAVNNNVLTTGFDFPELDLIAVLRPTKSPGLWVQMLGRGTRPAPDKHNCLVLDFAGNTKRLGPINDPKVPKPRQKGGGGGAPIKVCPACNTYNHTSVRFCICCGEEFKVSVKITEEASSMELIVGTEPVVENFEVQTVNYEKYVPRFHDKPPSLRVTYGCDTHRMFSEWIGFENTTSRGVRHRAHNWWRQRATTPPPESVDEAMTRIDELAAPTHIRVWLNTKSRYPEIQAYDFTGRGFDPA